MNEIDRPNPPYLLWLDLETSGLDPFSDHIIELGMVLTEFEYPHRTVQKGVESWIFDPRFEYFYDDHYENTLSEFIREMHTKSGLLAARREIPRELRRLPTEFEESVLLPMSRDWPDEKDRKVLLAGNSVHFDLSFIRKQFPMFARRLSHRVHDVSAVRSFCESLGKPRGPKPIEAHRAKEDVFASLKLAEDCVEYLNSSSFKTWFYNP